MMFWKLMFSVQTLQTSTTDLVQPLRELFALDSHLVHNMWVQLFSTIWTKFTKEEQNKLSKPIVQLLVKVNICFL